MSRLPNIWASPFIRAAEARAQRKRDLAALFKLAKAQAAKPEKK